MNNVLTLTFLVPLRRTCWDALQASAFQSREELEGEEEQEDEGGRGTPGYFCFGDVVYYPLTDLGRCSWKLYVSII